MIFAIPAIAHWKLGMNPIFAFWFAYVVTRPLGASFADWLAIPHSYGGLALGWGTISVVLTILIIGFVAFLAVTGKDVEERPGSRSRPRGGGGAGTRGSRGGKHRAQPRRTAGVAGRSGW